MNYFNEIEPFCVEVLRECIKEGVIADGVVDTRSITEVEPGDLRGFTQCHFFAGGGLWSIALRQAGWCDTRPVWTASCPCQPFSIAGKSKGVADTRHLWPHFYRLAAVARPTVVFGEQVSSPAGYAWFDGIASDMEGENYTVEAVDIPACAVNAPHRRNRLYWVARLLEDASIEPRGLPTATGIDAHGAQTGRDEGNGGVNLSGENHWNSANWIRCADEKVRRCKPDLRLLVDGLPGRINALRLAGNAIVPPLAAEFIKAFIEAEGERL